MHTVLNSLGEVCRREDVESQRTVVRGGRRPFRSGLKRGMRVTRSEMGPCEGRMIVILKNTVRLEQDMSGSVIETNQRSNMRIVQKRVEQHTILRYSRSGQ